jgi:hypothetical protein
MFHFFYSLNAGFPPLGSGRESVNVLPPQKWDMTTIAAVKNAWSPVLFQQFPFLEAVGFEPTYCGDGSYQLVIVAPEDKLQRFWQEFDKLPATDKLKVALRPVPLVTQSPKTPFKFAIEL